VNECDFWGLTDNDEISSHLQSYFLIFRNRVIQSDCFAQFWKSVLPYKNKDQIIRSYEVGLTIWLQQNGFKWKALYPQCEIFERYVVNREKRSFLTKFLERLKGRGLPVILSGKNTTLYFPDFLIDSGMPFLKLSLLKSGNERIQPIFAYKLLQSSDLPKDALEELRASLKVQ
jgi:Rhamnan synthesis protein F